MIFSASWRREAVSQGGVLSLEAICRSDALRSKRSGLCRQDTCIGCAASKAFNILLQKRAKPRGAPIGLQEPRPAGLPRSPVWNRSEAIPGGLPQSQSQLCELTPILTG